MTVSRPSPAPRPSRDVLPGGELLLDEVVDVISRLDVEGAAGTELSVVVFDSVVRVSWTGRLSGVPLRDALEAAGFRVSPSTSPVRVVLHRRLPAWRWAAGLLEGGWDGELKAVVDRLDAAAVFWSFDVPRAVEVAARLFLDDLGALDEVLPSSTQLVVAASRSGLPLRSPAEYLAAGASLCG